METTYYVEREQSTEARDGSVFLVENVHRSETKIRRVVRLWLKKWDHNKFTSLDLLEAVLLLLPTGLALPLPPHKPPPTTAHIMSQQTDSQMWSTNYDVVIVGAGVAGSALAHALSTSASSSTRKPLRIALLERSLSEPDRIVGELLQPGGVMALRALGMEDCLDGIDAVPVHGYCVAKDGAAVHIPYPDTYKGRSFHHGKFIMKLREKALNAPGVDVVEAIASELIECPFTGRVLGIKATRKGQEEKETFFADLVVIADGCFSNFRSTVLGEGTVAATKSYFVGLVLEDATLPIPKHGTVALVKGHGPVLLYQIGTHDTRLLVDVKTPFPSDLKVSSHFPLFELKAQLCPKLPHRNTSSTRSSRSSPRLSTCPFKPRSRPNEFVACQIPSSPQPSRAGAERRRVRSFSGTRGTCGTRSRAVA